MNRPEQSHLQQHSPSWAGGDEWDEYRPIIQDLYLSQNLALKEVMKIMEEKHGFKATQRMYKTRIKSWGLDKNFKESEVVELFRLKRERDRMGKVATTYSIRGREVDWERVQSYVKRKGLNMAVLINTAPHSPSSGEVTCRTPTPEDVERRRLPTLSPASSASTSQGVRTPVSALYHRPSPPYEVRQPPPIVSTTPYRPPSTSVPFSTQRPETLHRLQNCLTNMYETVLYEDGDKSWGTTEYWLRNARSQEWIMTMRYKLALYRDFMHAEAARGSAEVMRFRAINRSFAILEPLSGGIIGTRMFYLVSFFYAFAETSPYQNPFSSTAKQLLEAVEATCSVPAISAMAPGVMHDNTNRQHHHRPGRLPEINTMDEDSEMGDSDDYRPPPPPRFVDSQTSFQDSAGRFLAAILARMVKTLGLTLPSESVLLLEATHDGYPVVPPSTHEKWRCHPLTMPPPQTQSHTSSPSPSNRHPHHLSPHPASQQPQHGPKHHDAIQSAAYLLDYSIYLLSQRQDARAEETLLALLSSVDRDHHPYHHRPSTPSSSSTTTSTAASSPSETGSTLPLPPGSSPGPSSGIVLPGLGSLLSSSSSSSSSSPSSREAKVLARCAHYHLSRIYQRRAVAAAVVSGTDAGGGGGVVGSDQLRLRAREHMVRSVRESLLFDSFVAWEEVEFLFG